MNDFTNIAKVLEVAEGDHMERVTFGNGRGVSIVRHWGSYGGRNGLFEVAVLDAAGELDYSTSVTGDVLGYLTPQEVVDTMKAVADLPAPGSRADKLQKLQAARLDLEAEIAEKQTELDNLRRDYGDLNQEVSALEG